MVFSIAVENIKCGGCANTIRKRVMAVPGVRDAEVSTETGEIRVEADESCRAAVVESLLQAGYPETGSLGGVASLKAKATSFVSCAIGRMGS